MRHRQSIHLAAILFCVGTLSWHSIPVLADSHSKVFIGFSSGSPDPSQDPALQQFPPQQQFPDQQFPGQQQYPQQQLPPQQYPPRHYGHDEQRPPPQGAMESVIQRIQGCRPTPELCNGKDDDCDGFIDNHIPSQSCSPGESMQGSCFTAHTSCINGQTVCDVDSAQHMEICNGLDDDCDGIVDNHIPPQTCLIDMDIGYGITACRQGRTLCLPAAHRPVNPNCEYGVDCGGDRSNLTRKVAPETKPSGSEIERVAGAPAKPAVNTGPREGDDCSAANFIEPGKFPVDLEGYSDDITLSCGIHGSADRFFQLSVDAGTVSVSFSDKDNGAVWALYEGSCGSLHEVFCGTGTTPHMNSNVYYLVVEMPPNSPAPRSIVTITHTP